MEEAIQKASQTGDCKVGHKALSGFTGSMLTPESLIVLSFYNCKVISDICQWGAGGDTQEMNVISQ